MAVGFDGSSSTWHYPDSSDLDFGDTDDITILLWYYDAFIVTKGGVTGSFSGNCNYFFEVGSSTLTRFLYRNSANNTWHIWEPTTDFPYADGWHHAAMKYTFGTGSSLEMFLDGASKSGGWNSGNGNDAPRQTSCEVGIGFEKCGATESWAQIGSGGRIAELVIVKGDVPNEVITAHSKGVSWSILQKYVSSKTVLYVPAWRDGTDLSGNNRTSTETGLTVENHAPVGRYVNPPQQITRIYTQVARPSSDQSIGNWEDEGGATTDLYQSIDEETASDSDYIQSEINPSTSSCQVTLQNLTDPESSSGHIVRYRYRKDNDNSTIDITVRLKQGGTTIASQTHNGVSTTWTDGSFTLTGGEADNITDYTDLRIEFEADAS